MRPLISNDKDYTGFILIKKQNGKNLFEIKMKESIEEINQIFKKEKVCVGKVQIEIISVEKLLSLQEENRILKKKLKINTTTEPLQNKVKEENIKVNEAPRVLHTIENIPKKNELKFKETLNEQKKKDVPFERSKTKKRTVATSKLIIPENKNLVKKGDNSQVEKGTLEGEVKYTTILGFKEANEGKKKKTRKRGSILRNIPEDKFEKVFSKIVNNYKNKKKEEEKGRKAQSMSRAMNRIKNRRKVIETNPNENSSQINGKKPNKIKNLASQYEEHFKTSRK